ncbi:unnamed protein product, partial [Allacma fusca]
MLTKYENRFNTRTLKFLSRIGFLPLEIVSSKNHIDRIVIDPKSRKYRVWVISVLVLAFHVAYTWARLLQATIFPEFLTIPHLPVHFFAAVIDLLSFFSYTYFIKWPESTMEVFNNIISNFPDEVRKTRGIQDMNRQEVAAMLAGIIVPVNACSFAVILASDNLRLHLLYSAVPDSLKGFPMLFVCMTIDIVSPLCFLSGVYLVLLLHICFFEMVNAFLVTKIVEVKL